MRDSAHALEQRLAKEERAWRLRETAAPDPDEAVYQEPKGRPAPKADEPSEGAMVIAAAALRFDGLEDSQAERTLALAIDAHAREAVGAATDHVYKNLMQRIQTGNELLSEAEAALARKDEALRDIAALAGQRLLLPTCEQIARICKKALGEDAPLCSICRRRHGREIEHACE